MVEEILNKEEAKEMVAGSKHRLIAVKREGEVRLFAPLDERADVLAMMEYRDFIKEVITKLTDVAEILKEAIVAEYKILEIPVEVEGKA